MDRQALNTTNLKKSFQIDKKCIIRIKIAHLIKNGQTRGFF
jgi:hypothetical protein